MRNTSSKKERLVTSLILENRFMSFYLKKMCQSIYPLTKPILMTIV
jgi:hypothetical protein